MTKVYGHLKQLNMAMLLLKACRKDNVLLLIFCGQNILVPISLYEMHLQYMWQVFFKPWVLVVLVPM